MEAVHIIRQMSLSVGGVPRRPVEGGECVWRERESLELGWPGRKSCRQRRERRLEKR